MRPIHAGCGTGHRPGEPCPVARPNDQAHPIDARIIAIIVILVALYAGIHIHHAEQTKSTPPAACQFLGGTWNMWDGWTCN